MTVSQSSFQIDLRKDLEFKRRCSVISVHQLNVTMAEADCVSRVCQALES